MTNDFPKDVTRWQAETPPAARISARWEVSISPSRTRWDALLALESQNGLNMDEPG